MQASSHAWRQQTEIGDCILVSAESKLSTLWLTADTESYFSAVYHGEVTGGVISIA